MKPAVEEFLRYDGSVQINHRLLQRDMTFSSGEPVPAGEMVDVSWWRIAIRAVPGPRSP